MSTGSPNDLKSHPFHGLSYCSTDKKEALFGIHAYPPKGQEPSVSVHMKNSRPTVKQKKVGETYMAYFGADPLHF